MGFEQSKSHKNFDYRVWDLIIYLAWIESNEICIIKLKTFIDALNQIESIVYTKKEKYFNKI